VPADRPHASTGETTVRSAIRAEGLTRSFGAVAAVERLTFSVSPGEIFGLVGPDGAGKTTTMRLLAAILPPTAGDAWVAAATSWETRSA
jgi:ABC-2 type transport system ATP-binding protein